MSDGTVPIDSAEQGIAWLDRPGGSVALAVPSVIIPERNILLNPNHTDYINVAWDESHPLTVDPSLIQR